jgi:hypothetical protein
MPVSVITAVDVFHKDVIILFVVQNGSHLRVHGAPAVGSIFADVSRGAALLARNIL